MEGVLFASQSQTARLEDDGGEKIQTVPSLDWEDVEG